MKYLEIVFLNNPLYLWAKVLLFALLCLLLAKLIYRICKNYLQKIVKSTETKIDDIILDVLEEPITILIAGFGIIWVPNHLLALPMVLHNIMDYIWIFMLYLLSAWVIIGFLESLYDEYINEWAEEKAGDLAHHFVPFIRRGINILIWIIAILLALKSIGYDVGALIAGLGVGGLAFALAAQSTISNLYGGLTILTDQPFIKGNRILINGYEGIVQDVGIRSIKLKTIEGAMVTIPNSTVVDSCITNISSEKQERVEVCIGLTYDTTSKQIRDAMNILKEIIRNNEHTEDNATVLFEEFGDSSLNLRLVYNIIELENSTKDPWEVREAKIKSEINLVIYERLCAENFDFAFPTQTLHIQSQE